MTPKKEATKPEAKQEVKPPQPPAPASAPATEEKKAPTKQEITLEKLKLAWDERKVDLSKLQVKMDGKFMLINVDANWPTIKLGPSGGGEVPQIRSYAKFFEAAVIADQLLAKQTERDQKKIAAAPKPEAAKTEEKKAVSKETVTQKKAKADQKLERQLQEA